MRSPRGEGDGFAEAVHGVDEAILLRGAEGGEDESVEVVPCPALELGRDGVGAEEGGRDVTGRRVERRRGGAEHA
jgi:hypothetical protein